MNHIVGLSGGKDSTAMALRLRELNPHVQYTFLCTPTGDELPDMLAHWARLEVLLQTPLTRLTNHTLAFWIDEFKALPNWRQRWCTRLLKIEPTIAYIKTHQPAVLYVGLRADEEERNGIYSADVQSIFPLRDWKWGLDDVMSYLTQHNICIPERTDCARCYGQRLIEWKKLLINHPEIYADAELDEAKTGATFRSPGRDTWPASLKDLRREFETGRKVRGENHELELQACRVCSL